ncbi:MAG: bacterioferritin [Pseudohongiellaceae bacterium]
MRRNDNRRIFLGLFGADRSFSMSPMDFSKPDPKVLKLLADIVEFELAGVVRYTHYALMVRGPNRIPIVDFLQAQADESLVHARSVGELLTGLGGHPTLGISHLIESERHGVTDVLEESFAHESRAIEYYTELLALTSGKSVLLEEFARQMISAEESHLMELHKMLRDME